MDSEDGASECSNEEMSCDAHTTTASATQLPVELLVPILQQVLRNSRDDLLTCMQANQLFFETGFHVLYRNVSLKLKDAFRFEKSIKRYLVRGQSSNELHFPYIRGLRIVIPGDGRDYGFGALTHPATPSEPSGPDLIAERGVEALTAVLPYLSKLRTLSIVSYNGHRLNTWDEQGLGMPSSAATLSASTTRARGPNTNIIAKLVEAIPETVRDLSIDLSELSRYEPMLQCHLCPAINTKLTQLEHLNMHLRSYCPQLIVHEVTNPPVYTSLKSVIMRIHGFSARVCSKVSHSNVLSLDMFTRNMKSIMQAGSLPGLEQFVIISKRRPLGVRQHADAKWSIYVRELVANQTAAIPRIFIDSRTPEPGNTFTVSARTMVRLPPNCSFIYPAYWNQEYVGKSGSIRRFVEGRAGWVSFVQGPHLPGLRGKEITAMLDEGWDIKAPLPKTVKEWRAKEEKTCQLWDDETVAGTKLLEPAVWSGVLDNHVLTRLES